MEIVSVNYLAVLACGVLSMGLGTLWYGPLFGKPWMAMMGFSKETIDATAKNEMMRSYGIMFVGSLITAFTLAHVLTFATAYLGSSGVMSGISTGFWMWLGFMAPVSLGTVLWEGKPWKLFAINSGYNLVFLVLAGIILALWV